jgi:single-strand DNA-binding protein
LKEKKDMSDDITLTGLVATTPRHMVSSEGQQITSFRLASTQRRFNPEKGAFEDSDTNWYTVTAFRDLAVNIVGSVAKGQRVIVTGRLRIRDWQADEKSGTSVEVEADTLGHDLRFGEAQYTRTLRAEAAPSEDPTTV